MNILPKKRWHVRTKDNVARVRRDEAQAAAEAKSIAERAALAEQEARTKLLRDRAASKKTAEEGSFAFKLDEKIKEKYQLDSGTGGHVNFFADLEEQQRTFGANKDHDEEKRLEKEAEERKIGLLKYLGEGSSEYMKETPWYQKPRSEGMKKDENLSKPKQEGISGDSTAKVALRSVGPSVRHSTEIVFPSDIAPLVAVPSKKRKKHKKEKRKKEKKRRKRESSEEITSTSEEEEDAKEASTEKNANLERLRAERLRREKEERLKTERLLRQKAGIAEPAVAKPVEPNYEQRYSSQFNPQIARQNRV